jgi:hypothetical protein
MIKKGNFRQERNQTCETMEISNDMNIQFYSMKGLVNNAKDKDKYNAI